MLWTLAVVLLAFWAVGLATSTILGGYLHLLLVFAVIAVALRLVQDRRARHHRELART